MRRLCVLWAALLGIGLTGAFSVSISSAAEMTACDVPSTGPSQCYGTAGASNAGCGCVAVGVPCRGPNCVERAAAVGEFNCTCRGSYKFPVPQQYTYHWPGMYAQQTMTEYVSPWRYEVLTPNPIRSVAPLVTLPPPPLAE